MTATVTALQTMDAIIERARQNLTPELWDYVSGGAESETTLRRNRAGFERIGFRPKLLSTVLDRHTRTTFLGADLALNLPTTTVSGPTRSTTCGRCPCRSIRSPARRSPIAARHRPRSSRPTRRRASRRTNRTRSATS